MPLLRDIFINLSDNQILNNASKKMGLKFGAQKVVGGITVEETIAKIEDINGQGMSVSFDNLGEFITDKNDARDAKNHIIKMIKAIGENGLDASGSIKMTQIGLNIDHDFCVSNTREILKTAKNENMFINIDMEDYASHDDTIRVVDLMMEEFDNVGTVLQSYLFNSAEDVYKYKDRRLRLVKGAYKEAPRVAFQEKEDIDEAFKKLIHTHLTEGDGTTSIATHDHNIINDSIEFIDEHGIPNDQFEFQMLYGFRKELQAELAEKGYNVCVYVPTGNDWYAYFMRRLAERPQNINLVLRSITKDPIFKTAAVGTGVVLAGTALYKLLGRNK